MLKNDSTRKPRSRQRQEPYFDEPIRRWANVPVSRERACELVDLVMRHDEPEIRDTLIELMCGLMPHAPSDDKYTLDERFLAGSAALMCAFTETRRAGNELGAYLVHLKCARWE